MEKNSFGAKVKKLLRERGITQKEFAVGLHMDDGTLSTYLREKKPVCPNIEIAKSIAEKLNVSLDYLCGLSEKSEIKEEPIVSAETLLRNLYKVYKDTRLNVQLGANAETSFTTRNNYIYLFFSQLSQSSNDDTLELLSNFSGLKVYDGSIMSKTEYAERMRLNYIYSDYEEGEADEEWEPVRIEREKEFDQALKEGKILCKTPSFTPVTVPEASRQAKALKGS